MRGVEVDLWLDHPIVRFALERLPADYSTADLFSAVLDIMNELEDRFPGLSFTEIFQITPPSPDARKAMRARLERAGLLKSNIDLILGRNGNQKFAPGQLELLRTAYATRDGSASDFCREHGLSPATLFRLARNGWSYGTPPSRRMTTS